MIVKKLSLAVLALGVVGVANAGGYTAPACSPANVTVPCEDTAWDIGFEAFFAEAGTNNQAYVYTDSRAVSQSTSYDVAGREHVIDSDYEFGFVLEGSYHFSTGNDVVVSWEHSDNSNYSRADLAGTDATTQRYATPVIGYIGESTVAGNATVLLAGLIGDSINADGNTGINTVAEGWMDYDFDAVNFELGQHVDVGANYDLRIHGGFQYAQIDVTKKIRMVTTSTNSNSETIVNTFNSNQNSEFDGFGVRFGADMAYALSDGFSLVGRASASLLFGEVDNKWSINNSNVNTTLATAAVVNNIAHDQESESLVVPAAMGKVGLNYQTDMMDGHFAIEGGWRWEGFYQAVRMDTTSHLDNFTLSGPFVAVKYVS